MRLCPAHCSRKRRSPRRCLGGSRVEPPFATRPIICKPSDRSDNGHGKTALYARPSFGDADIDADARQIVLIGTPAGLFVVSIPNCVPSAKASNGLRTSLKAVKQLALIARRRWGIAEAKRATCLPAIPLEPRRVSRAAIASPDSGLLVPHRTDRTLAQLTRSSALLDIARAAPDWRPLRADRSDGRLPMARALQTHRS